MHNAATSFDNVLRGLGHWATFVSFAGRAYFPWAASYAAGIFGALLWFVPIVALGGIAFKRNQRPATLFFLIVTIVSVPLVVGYYHDALGDAVTEPIYNVFYRNFPGFQMFRFSYKWVAGVEFGMSALFRDRRIGDPRVAARAFRRTQLSQRRWNWLAPAAATAADRDPDRGVCSGACQQDELRRDRSSRRGSIARRPWSANDASHRVALFPTQYLEQFDWGSPQFYIEDSFVDRPMIYGLLGGEPSEGTDVWVRRSYRAAREGLPFAADMLRVLGVDTILQRDDFIPAIDFSSPGEWRFNTTTLTHDLLHRVVGATPVRSDGPLRVYHLSGALPLVYGVTHPVVEHAADILGRLSRRRRRDGERAGRIRTAEPLGRRVFDGAHGALTDPPRLARASPGSGRQRGARARRRSDSPAPRRRRLDDAVYRAIRRGLRNLRDGAVAAVRGASARRTSASTGAISRP